MRRVTLAEIQNIAEYEKIRPDMRRQIIDLKKRRRVSVGEYVTFLFENTDTVRWQIQEMLRAERIVHEEKIQHEVDTYNQLLPTRERELAATLFIEITDPDRMKDILDALMGIDRGDWVSLEIGRHRIVGSFESGHSSEIKLSAVHHVRFALTPEQVDDFRDPALPAALVVDHPANKARAPIPPEVRRALLPDLE